MPIRPETIAVNDITMAFNRYGERRGDEALPLVMVHGITGARHDFRLVVEPLSQDRTVFVVDQRGHGETSNPADPNSYAFSQLVDDLAGFVQQAVGSGPVHLLGHSMGGMVSMRYAIAHPERLQSLILMNTSAESPQMPFDLEADFIDGLFAAAEEHGLEVAREMNKAVEGEERAVVDRIHGPAFFAEDEDWRYRHLDVHAVSRLGPITFRHPSVLERMDAITVPTTVIVGSEDGGFLAPSERLAEAIPNAELRVIDGAFHSPQHTHTEQWLDVVAEHFDRAI